MQRDGLFTRTTHVYALPTGLGSHIQYSIRSVIATVSPLSQPLSPPISTSSPRIQASPHHPRPIHRPILLLAHSLVRLQHLPLEGSPNEVLRSLGQRPIDRGDKVGVFPERRELRKGEEGVRDCHLDGNIQA